MAVNDRVLKAIKELNREDQLNLAQWILSLDERDFELDESPADLSAIRRGLDSVKS